MCAVIIMVVSVTAVVGTALAVMFFINRPACYRTGEAMDRPVQWNPLAGCFVEGDDGRWYPPENIREPEAR